MTTPSWFEDWVSGELNWKDEHVLEALHSLREKPAAIRGVLRVFPPSCVVRAKQGTTYRCPAPGSVAIVTSVLDEESVSVREHPDALVRWQVPLQDLEYVAAHKGLTREKMQEILTPE